MLKSSDSADKDTAAMYEIKQMPIPSHVAAGDHVQFVSLALGTEPALPLAVAYYTVDGHFQSNGLRLDLDKRIMLDSLEDIRPQSEAQVNAERLFHFLATDEAAELIRNLPSQILAVSQTSQVRMTASSSAG